jgi:hypothetical protein
MALTSRTPASCVLKLPPASMREMSSCCTGSAWRSARVGSTSVCSRLCACRSSEASEDSARSSGLGSAAGVSSWASTKCSTPSAARLQRSAQSRGRRGAA